MHYSRSPLCVQRLSCAANRTLHSENHTSYAVQDDLPLQENVNDTEGDIKALKVQLPGWPYQWGPLGRLVCFYRRYTRYLLGQHFLQPFVQKLSVS